MSVPVALPVYEKVATPEELLDALALLGFAPVTVNFTGWFGSVLPWQESVAVSVSVSPTWAEIGDAPSESARPSLIGSSPVT